MEFIVRVEADTQAEPNSSDIERMKRIIEHRLWPLMLAPAAIATDFTVTVKSKSNETH
jgi:hypothetical protein